VVNLNILLPGQYLAYGTYGLESGLNLEFAGPFRVESFPDDLSIEGKVQHRRSDTTYPFRASLTRDEFSKSQALASITIAGMPELKGRACLVPPTREVLASEPHSLNQLSVRVVPLESPRVYEVTGILALGGKTWFPFHFRVTPMEAEVALENVVALPKRSA